MLLIDLDEEQRQRIISSLAEIFYCTLPLSIIQPNIRCSKFFYNSECDYKFQTSASNIRIPRHLEHICSYRPFFSLWASDACFEATCFRSATRSSCCHLSTFISTFRRRQLDKFHCESLVDEGARTRRSLSARNDLAGRGGEEPRGGFFRTEGVRDWRASVIGPCSGGPGHSQR